ncbi:MAG TPA: riboflavin synthase [Candidatus Udaeobacter sp.]|jgi:riboflavin synthase|nr:riboflavin synthase [Candidatus Udaeobacter sp.]
MFTGLVEEIGRIERVADRGEGRTIEISATRVLDRLERGDSVAINGCCLTVIDGSSTGFTVEAVPETLRRTTLGAFEPGEPVNLERALRFDQRLGGHLMQGHVDAVGEVRAIQLEGDGRRVRFEVPEALRRFVAEKGSIAVDGVSLTVAALVPEGCEIAYIPHTLAHTLAGSYAVSRRVNLEVDLIARYLARLLDHDSDPGRTT